MTDTIQGKEREEAVKRWTEILHGIENRFHGKKQENGTGLMNIIQDDANRILNWEEPQIIDPYDLRVLLYASEVPKNDIRLMIGKMVKRARTVQEILEKEARDAKKSKK